MGRRGGASGAEPNLLFQAEMKEYKRVLCKAAKGALCIGRGEYKGTIKGDKKGWGWECFMDRQ